MERLDRLKNRERLTGWKSEAGSRKKNTEMSVGYKIALPVVFAFFLAMNSLASDTISIRDAIDRGLVSVNAKSLGGHADECIEMSIENLIGKEVILRVEAGRQMISGDSSMQDILITKQYEFLLSETEKAELKIFGMCMRAHRRSPSEGSMFSVGKMADSLLVQLARFIDKFNYRNFTSQNAIWVLSDGNPLESVHSKPGDAVAKKLLEFMHILTKKPIPWYTIEYTRDTMILFTGKAETLHGYYQYSLPDNAAVTIGIYKEDGHLQTILFSQMAHSPGKYDYPFILDVSKWKKGNYYLKVFADDQLREKKLIVL